MNPLNKIGGLLFLALVAIVGLTIMFGSWYTVDQSKLAVLLRNGAFVEVQGPGLHVKWPMIEDYKKIDMQTHTRVWERMEAYSGDQQPAHMKVSVTLHVNPDHKQVERFYSNFGGDWDNALARLVSPQVPARTKIVFGGYTAEKAIKQRGPLNADVAKSIGEALAYDPVFVIDSVQVEDIAFSDAYTKSIEARMLAEVEVTKFKQNLERERVSADIAQTIALGKANAVREEAKANADAITLRGNAEATAIEARAKALGQNPLLVELTKVERWNGTMPTTMLPSGTTPLLNLNSGPAR